MNLTNGVAACAMVCFCAPLACASFPREQPPVKSFDFPVSGFAVDPVKPLLYAISDYNEELKIINTNTLETMSTIPLSHYPRGLDFSPDGSKLYIPAANNVVDVLDTSTFELTHVPLNFHPSGIAVGFDGQMWLESNTIEVFGNYYFYPMVHRIDPKTGIETGLFQLWSDYGIWKMSPDRRTLFYGTVPNASDKAFDISGTQPTIRWQGPSGTVGPSGQDLVISHDGGTLAFVTGAFNGSEHTIELYNTVDGSQAGSMVVGDRYAQQIAFSPDDKLAYVVNEPQDIKVFKVDAKELVDEWHFGSWLDNASDLIVDNSGRYLFTIKSNVQGFQLNSLLVFATGREVPEPSCIGSAIFVFASCLIARKAKPHSRR